MSAPDDTLATGPTNSELAESDLRGGPDSFPPPVAPGRVSWRWHGLTRLVSIGLYCGLAGLVGLELLRRSGRSHPAWLLLMFGITPVFVAPTVFALATAAVLRRRILMLASVVVLAMQISVVAPALGSDAVASWAASAPTITVAFANLHGNGENGGKFATMATLGADVVIVVELTDDGVRILDDDNAMAATYPYRVLAPAAGTSGFGIFSKMPLIAAENPKPNSTLIESSVRVGTTVVHLLGEHTHSPTDAGVAAVWNHNFDRLNERLDQLEGPIILVGDFNATRWHRRFAELLDRGFVDGHEARGKGLSRSWPAEGRRLARIGLLMRLDHGLVNDGLAVTAVRDVPLDGSDHVGFMMTIAVRQ